MLDSWLAGSIFLTIQLFSFSSTECNNKTSPYLDALVSDTLSTLTPSPAAPAAPEAEADAPVPVAAPLSKISAGKSNQSTNQPSVMAI